MKMYRLLFSVGKDRPGIVHDVSTVLFDHGANIEDSRMAAMGGRFGIMTLFSCEAVDLDKIRAGLEGLKKAGLETSLHEAEDPTVTSLPAALPLNVEVTSMDHPGIVKKVVRILHNHQVNIRSLNTRVTRAPLSGAPLFDLSLEAAVPEEKPILVVKEELTALAGELNLDLAFKKNSPS